MVVRGTKPKDDDKKVTRVAPTHDWTQVPDVPFKGKRPKLPASRTLQLRDGDSRKIPLSAMTKAWWSAVSSMPHCVLWSESDWQFALATALVADQAFAGVVSAAAELRQREKILGTTVDSRRDLRIRYVTPIGSEEKAAEEKPAKVTPITHMAVRRRRLVDDDAP